MKVLFARLVGCVGAFALCGVLFPGACTLLGALWGGAFLTLLYALIRPLLQTLLLPLNLILFGIFTPLTDALLVLWACAWTPGTSLGYWQAVCAALLVSLFWLPCARGKRRESWRAK